MGSRCSHSCYSNVVYYNTPYIIIYIYNIDDPVERCWAVQLHCQIRIYTDCANNLNIKQGQDSTRKVIKQECIQPGILQS